MSRRSILTTIWLLWAALLFLLMIMLTMQSALFGADAQKAWQWFLPNLVPVLTLVGASAYASPAAPVAAANPPPPAGTFLLAVGSSVFYLLLLTGSLVSTLFSKAPLEALATSGLWLGPLQGIATSGLALYFVKK